MAAQRSEAMIDAVELEPEAASDALSNFRNSEWQSRISLTVCAFQNFDPSRLYDHIISNPPFFEHSPKSVDSKRAQARHSDSLRLDELLEKSRSMLSADGKISLILPAGHEERLRFLVREKALFIKRFIRVAPDDTKMPHRLLLELSACPVPQDVGPDIIIRHSGSPAYTNQYRELTKDFYLAF